MASLNPQQQHQLLLAQQQREKQNFGGKGQFAPQYQALVIPALSETLTEALIPFVHLDTTCSLEEMTKMMHSSFSKSAKRYEFDQRTQRRATAVDAQAIIEEFVFALMTSAAAGCFEKPWFVEADFTPALMVSAMHSFRNSYVFVRTLGPFVKRYVDSAVSRYREEQRIQKVMWDAVSTSSLSSSFHKSVCESLQATYDEAHVAAPYGSNAAATPELGLLQDFVTCWMTDFVSKTWDVLENGVAGGKEQHQSFLLSLFFHLTDPSRSILPGQMLKALQTPIPASWEFIGVVAEAVLKEMEEQSSQPNKKQRSTVADSPDAP